MKGSTTPGFGPNAASATAFAISVLPTPLGPRKRNDPINRPGSFIPMRMRFTAGTSKRTAWAWLITRALRSTPLLNRLSLAARVLRGMNTRQFTGKAHTQARALRIIGSRAHHAVTDILRNEAPYWTGALCPLAMPELGEGIEYRRLDAQIDAPLAFPPPLPCPAAPSISR